MKKVLLFFFPILFFAACNQDDDKLIDPNPGTGYEGYTLLWSDEFDSGVDPTNWTYEIGDGTDYGLPPGWGNNERQLYTDSQNNSLVRADEDGNSVLSITAKPEPGNNQYSSAKLTTQGLQSFRFGRIEARIKVPTGRGLWPAFWLLGENITELDWPGTGEIDIMEVIGHESNVLYSTVHFTDGENSLESDGGIYDAGTDLSEDYHEYRVDWTPTEMTFYLDGTEVHQVPIEADMKEFLRPMYLIFNVAVGGSWPGDPDETTEFPQTMLVDWVRAYSKDGLELPAAPALNIEEETIGTVSSSLPPHAFNDALDQFSGMVIKAFGDGGEPTVESSDLAVDGDSSLMFRYPGGSWGGGFFILEPTVDASQFANGSLKFSLNSPQNMADIEIKLESVATNFSVFLVDYTGVDVGNGFLEYTIPVSDFEDLDMSDLKIPFALWNPVDANGDWIPFNVIVDNIYFE